MWNENNPTIKKLLKLDWVRFRKTFEKELKYNSTRIRTRFMHEHKHENSPMHPKLDLNSGEREFMNYIKVNKLI